MKEDMGILLVAPGAPREAAAPVLARVERRVRRRFPGVTVRWAVGSDRSGGTAARMESPGDALAALRRAGVARVAVQSFHTIAGVEYHELCARLGIGRRPVRRRIAAGRPLLGSYGDVVRVGRALVRAWSPVLKPDEALILMGHGNGNHPAHLAYAACEAVFRRMDKRVLLATLKGKPGLNDAIRECLAAGVRKAYLAPFMGLAGRHAERDLAGEHAASWASRVTRAGIGVVPVLKGTMEYGGVTAVWLDHLAVAVRELGDNPGR
jgi:sirohydrochlorin cobaltochelatase